MNKQSAEKEPNIEETAIEVLQTIKNEKRLAAMKKKDGPLLEKRIQGRLIKLWEAAEENITDLLKQSATLSACLDEELRTTGLFIKVLYIMPSLKSPAMEYWLMIQHDEKGNAKITIKLVYLFSPRLPNPEYYSPRFEDPYHTSKLSPSVQVEAGEFLVKLADFRTAIPLLLRNSQKLAKG